MSRRSVSTEPVGRRVRLQLISVVTIVVTATYLVWRAAATLNPDAPILSWVFWALELYGALGLALFVHAAHVMKDNERPEHARGLDAE